jgi:hypothetical protein
MIGQLIGDSSAHLTLEDSPAYAGVHLAGADLDRAIEAIRTEPFERTFHLLMAVRRDAPESADRIDAGWRAGILVEALVTVAALNDFGYLDPSGSWDGPAAVALLQTGDQGAGVLRPVLTDRRPAPLYGSEMAALSHRYRYRRCDFAYRYLALLVGEDPTFDADLAGRERRIAELRRRLPDLQDSGSFD